MTTKPVRNVKVVIGKNGKPTLKRTRPFMAGKKDRDAARKADAWAKKNMPLKKNPAGEGGAG